MIEHFFTCPYCWQEISMLLDPAYSQTYVEDCEVCCNPIEVIVTSDNNEVIGFSVDKIDQ